jgi:hypothetical protein
MYDLKVVLILINHGPLCLHTQWLGVHDSHLMDQLQRQTYQNKGSDPTGL